MHSWRLLDCYCAWAASLGPVRLCRRSRATAAVHWPGVAFPDSDFTITAVGDTTNRMTSQPVQNMYTIPDDCAWITIQGLGTYVFLTSTSTFVNLDDPAIGFGFTSQAQYEGDLYNIWPAPGANNWDMLSSFGPISCTTGTLLQWQHSDINTSGGTLVFADQENVSCTFVAQVVPEPSSVLAMLCGIGGMAWRRRK